MNLFRSAGFRFRFLFLPSLFVAFVFTATSFSQTPTIDSEEQLMVRMINDYRAQNGLGKLSISISLSRASDWMSADMSTKNYFSHNDSLGRNPFDRMNAFGYTYKTTKGENLAAGYDDVARTFNQWKNSASHNAAMLNGAFKVIGISRVYAQYSQYKWYWTTDFGGYVDSTFDSGRAAKGQNVKTVNVANYFQIVVPEGIARVFGTQMTNDAASATLFPLPSSLARIAVSVKKQLAQLFYASGT